MIAPANKIAWLLLPHNLYFLATNQVKFIIVLIILMSKAGKKTLAHPYPSLYSKNTFEYLFSVCRRTQQILRSATARDAPQLSCAESKQMSTQSDSIKAPNLKTVSNLLTHRCLHLLIGLKSMVRILLLQSLNSEKLFRFFYSLQYAYRAVNKEL